MHFSIFDALLFLAADLKAHLWLVYCVDALKFQIEDITFFDVVVKLLQKIPFHHVGLELFYFGLDIGYLLL